MLITSDVNFAVDLSDLKNRKKMRVLLVHGRTASDGLLLCASQRFLYDDLVDRVPVTLPKVPSSFTEFHSFLPGISRFTRVTIGHRIGLGTLQRVTDRHHCPI